MIGFIGSQSESPKTASTTSGSPSAAAAKNEPPPPLTPAIGESVSQEYFQYIAPEMAGKCQREIKKFVKYDIRAPGVFWGTSSGDSINFLLRLTRVSRVVRADGTILLAGDDAEAQNEFVNRVRVNYSCRVDIATKTVTDASLNYGRLP